MTPEQAALAAKVEALEKSITEFREELAVYEQSRVKSGVDLASKIAGREITREELIERGRELEAEFDRRFGEQR